MEISIKDIFSQYGDDPLTTARLTVDRVSSAVGADYIPADPTVPYAFAIEMAIASGAACIEHIEAILPKVYPKLSQTQNDLFRHMSEVNFINIFGQPSINGFYLQFNLQEVQSIAPMVNQATNSRKLIIPANSVFSVGATNFTLLYPIELRFRGRSLNVVYDTNNPNLIQPLMTNIVDWKIVEQDDDIWLQMHVPIKQLDMLLKQAKTSAMSVFSETYSFVNEYHAARVFQVDNNGNRIPVTITYSDYTFDHKVLTALLRVEGNQLHVYIPPIYFTNGMVMDNLEIEIYSTQGPLAVDFDQFGEDNFNIAWDKEAITKNVYSAPLSRLTIRRVLSSGLVSSGRRALSFDEIRDGVINNTLDKTNPPITTLQLAADARDRGFSLVTVIDTITRLVYQATRRLPAPENNFTFSGIGARIGTVITSIEKLAELGVIWDNGDRVTISPGTLYNERNSIITPMHIDFPDTIKSLPVEAQVADIMANNYLYSPFHYVLDSTGYAFESRVYYLMEPTVENGVHVADNETTGMVVSLIQAGLERTPNGYRITLVTTSNAAFKELDPLSLYMVLSFTPHGENDQAHILGQYVQTVNIPDSPMNGEFIFLFEIDSNFDIDVNNNIVITNSYMYDLDTLLNLPTNLETNFDIRLAIKDFVSPTVQPSPILDEIPRFFLDNENTDLMDVVHDRISVKFGDALVGLWSEARNTVSERDYLKHTEDVYLTYKEDVYEMIPGTNAIKTEVVNGVIVYKKLHLAGDFELDSNGQKILLFLAGTNVLDEFGYPIIAEPRKLQNELNLFLMDGAYFFATEEASVFYRDSVVGNMIDWLSSDIAFLRTKLLPRTELYFYPQTTIGRINAAIDGEVIENVDSEQKFTVKCIVTDAVYKNDKLRKTLEDQVKVTITNVLDSQTVSMSDMITRLEDELKEHVLGVDITGLAGNLNAVYVSMEDDSQRMTIGKRIVNRVDGKLAIEDDIEFNWVINNLG